MFPTAAANPAALSYLSRGLWEAKVNAQATCCAIVSAKHLDATADHFAPEQSSVYSSSYDVCACGS